MMAITGRGWSWSMSSSINIRQQKLLIAHSGNRCAFPECRSVLSVASTRADGAAILGEMAHIKGERPEAPRYDPLQSDQERNSHKNLLYLCPSCHTIIDKQEKTYPVEFLLKLKSDHEKWV